MKTILAHLENNFRARERGRKQRRRCVGLELKFPLVGQDGQAITLATLDGLWDFLADQGWIKMRDAHFGRVTGVRRKGRFREDVITTESSYCKLEIALGYQEDLFALEQNLEAILDTLRAFGKEQKVRILGLGIQPLSAPSPRLLAPKARNLFWETTFGRTQVELFALSATNQVHVDVTLAESIQAVNLFNGLAGVQLALAANSTVWKGVVDPVHKAVAEQFWDWWLPGNPRVGFPPRPFADLEDYVRTIASYRPVYVAREGKFFGLGYYPSFEEYWRAGAQAVGLTPTGQEVPLLPQPEDFDLHRTFCWHDARLSTYFTLENRVCCQQPPGTQMVVAALTLGLLEVLEEAGEVLKNYSWAALGQARKAAIHHGMQATVAGQPIAVLAREVLELASKGLRARGLGEERFLAPLWQRLEEQKCPADHVRALFTAQGLGALLESFTL